MDREEFRKWSDLLEDAWVLVGTDRVIIELNFAAAKTLNLRRAEVIGLSLTKLLADPPERIEEFFRIGSSSRQFVPGALTFRLNSGQMISCRCDLAASSTRPGSPVILRIRDRRNADQSFTLLNRERDIERLAGEIEHRKRAEESLHNEREWFRVTLSSIGDGVIATDADARVTFLNPVAETLTGWTLAEAAGKPITQIFKILNEETRASVVNPVSRAIREGVIVGLANHSILLSRDSKERPIDDSAAPIKAADGRILGAVLVFRDVSKRRAEEHALERAHEELEERVRERTAALEAVNAALSENEKQLRNALQDARVASEAKDEWISVLSHELRTPLTPILGWSRMLRGGKLKPPEMSRGIEIIERNVQAQMRIVEDLLDISRMVAGKLNLVLEAVDLRKAVSSAVDAVRSSAAVKQVSLNVELPDQPVIVLGDTTRLQQAFWNLLSNAIKFSNKGGQVLIKVNAGRDLASVEIQDDGIGINPGTIPHLFQKFRQEDASTTRMFGGLGLGLAIVKHIVDVHNGSVSANSEGKGRGATFTISLPIRCQETASSGELVSVDAEPNLSELRILIVDDEPDTLELIAFSTRQYGAISTTVNSVAAAVTRLQAEHFDVIVSDLGMPHEDGFALIRRVREMKLNIPVIALTAYARDDDRARVLDAGFRTYLAKPTDPKALACAIQTLAKRP